MAYPGYQALPSRTSKNPVKDFDTLMTVFDSSSWAIDEVELETFRILTREPTKQAARKRLQRFARFWDMGIPINDIVPIDEIGDEEDDDEEEHDKEEHDKKKPDKEEHDKEEEDEEASDADGHLRHLLRCLPSLRALVEFILLLIIILLVIIIIFLLLELEE